MNLLLLSGNSLRNKPWIYEVQTSLSDLFTDSFVHEYNHWITGQEAINIDTELSTVPTEAENLKPYCIFAKSVGSVLTIKGMTANQLQPTAVLITGLPLRYIEKEMLPITDWLQTVDVPMIIAQHDKDPLGSYKEVHDLIMHLGNESISTIQLPGDTHDYKDLAKLKKLMSTLISKTTR